MNQNKITKKDVLQLVDELKTIVPEIDIWRCAKLYLSITEYKIGFKRSKDKRQYMVDFFQILTDKMQ